jgi:UDP-GlcNAc:undecaprenyl-phosphate GlcNAc-1-phosphate transferase
MPSIVLLLIALGIVISLPAVGLLLRWGHRAGKLDSSGAAGHGKQLRLVPNVGGIGIVVAVILPMVVGLSVVWIVDAETWQRWAPEFAPHLDRVRATTPTAVALIVALLVIHVLGLVDDRRSLNAIPKLIIQFAAAAMVVIWFDVRLLTLLGPVPSVIVTILWIVAITNAVNFMDNMDGLAAGVSLVAATLFMVACLVNHQWFIASTLALLIGGLIGFLVFNYPPARIFMGDGGSLFIGFLLGVLTARTTYYEPDLGGGWYGVFMPVIVLAVPLYDLVTVSIIRVRQGRSPFVGDQQHFSHRLLQRGLSTRAALWVVCGAAAVTGIGGVSLGRLAGWQALLVGVQTILVLLMIALLEHTSRSLVDRDADT